MARGRSLIRLIKIMLNLGGRPGKTVSELAARLGCVERTIWRDLQVLEAGGVPLTNERDGRHTRWFIADGHTRSLGIPFTHDELLALHFGRHLLQSLKGTVFAEALQSALDKIEAGVSPAALRLLREFDQGISARTPGFKEYSRFRETIEILREAIERRRTVEIQYHSFGRGVLTTRRVDPFQLWYQHGGLYLAAYCHTREDVRTFAIERFRRVTPRPETFIRPAGFDLEKYLEASFGLFRGKAERIRLRFSPAVARYVEERQWHPSQRSERLLTGELEVTLKVAPEMDLKRWILGWGKDVEVPEPKRLRDEIRAEWLAALRGAGGRRERLIMRPGPSGRPQARRSRARLTETGKRLPLAGAVAAAKKT
jgi:predicted DNA-binding transcriptional regulator YafY